MWDVNWWVGPNSIFGKTISTIANSGIQISTPWGGIGGSGSSGSSGSADKTMTYAVIGALLLLAWNK